MNYYERHLGDYARDTSHLTMLEHGAYNLLMDRYYVSESGIPEVQAYRYAHARSEEEKAAVDAVLSEFFTLVNGVWIKNRIEEEITKAQTKIKAAQENGKKGGRPKTEPKQTEDKPSGLSLGLENETKDKAHQTPDTNHHIKPEEHTQSLDNSNSFEPTPAASVCIAIAEIYRQHNKNPFDVAQTNPTLTELLKAGASVAEFVDSANAAMQSAPPKGFAWILGRVKRQREDALSTNFAKGTVKPREDLTWRTNDSQILLKAQAMKIHTQGKTRYDLLASIDAKREEMEKAA